MYPQSFIKKKEVNPSKLIEQALHDKTIPIPANRFYQSTTEASSSSLLNTFDSPTRKKRKLPMKLFKQEQDRVTSKDPIVKYKKPAYGELEIINKLQSKKNDVEILDERRDEKQPVVSPRKRLYKKELEFRNSYTSPNKRVQRPQSISLIEKEKNSSVPTVERNRSCVWVSDEEPVRDFGKSEKPILIGTPEEVFEGNHVLAKSKERLLSSPSFELTATSEDRCQAKDTHNTSALGSCEASIVIGTPEEQKCSMDSLKESANRDSVSPELFSTPSKAKSRQTNGNITYTPCAQKPMMSLECLLIGSKHYNGVTERILLSQGKDAIELYLGCDQLAAIPFNRITTLKYYNQTYPYLIVLKTSRPLKNEKLAAYYDPDSLTPKKTLILCFFKNPPDKLVEYFEQVLRFSCEPLSKIEWDKLCNESSPDSVPARYKGKDLNLQHYFGNTEISRSTCGNEEESTSHRNSFLQRSPAKTPRTYSRRSNSRNKQSLELFVYPFDRVNALAITNDDVFRLSEGEFLNDTLVEFYMRYMQNELSKRDPKLANKVHFFNPFFYHRLTQKNSSSNAYEKVKKWTSKIDLFEKNYIFVPINENLHWYLALICFPALLLDNYPRVDRSEASLEVQDRPESDSEAVGVDFHLIDEAPKDTDSNSNFNKSNRSWIIIFDSLNSRHESVFEVLNTYLYHEAKEKKNVKIRQKAKGIYAKVPCQTNHCDCGVYLLQYVETFLRDPQKYLDLTVNQVDNSIAWFSHKQIGRKREQIRTIVHELTKEFQKISQSSEP